MNLNTQIEGTKVLINEYSKEIEDTDNKIYQLDKMIEIYKSNVKEIKNLSKLLIFGLPVASLAIVGIANLSSFIMEGELLYLPSSMEALLSSLVFFIPSTLLGTYTYLKADKMTEEEMGIKLKDIKNEKLKYVIKKSKNKDLKIELEDKIDDLLFLDECMNKYENGFEEKEKVYVLKK